MRGELSETSWPVVLDALAEPELTGLLVIDGGAGPGVVRVRAGRIVGAATPSAGARYPTRLSGANEADPSALVAEQLLDTLAELSSWRVGRFALIRDTEVATAARAAGTDDPDALELPDLIERTGWDPAGAIADAVRRAAATPVPIEVAVNDVSERLAERREELASLRWRVPDLQVPVCLRSGDDAVVSDQAQRLLSFAEDGGSLAELARACGLSDWEARRAAAELAEHGRLELGLHEDGVGAALDEALHTPEPEPEPEPESEPDPTPVPEPTPSATHDDDDADVSVFLRELSRLSGDQPSPRRDEQRTGEGGRPDQRSGGGGRRRGLFGRG